MNSDTEPAFLDLDPDTIDFNSLEAGDVDFAASQLASGTEVADEHFLPAASR